MSQPLNEEETNSLWEKSRAHGLAGEFELCLEATNTLRGSLIDGAAPPKFFKENSTIRNEDLLRTIAIKGCDDNIAALKKRLGEDN